MLAVFLSILIDYLPKVSYIYLEFEIKRGETIASSSTTYVIDQLHKKGYVTRTPSEKDRRITYVELTEAGKTLIKEIFPTHAKRIAEAFEQLSSEELTLLQKTLRKITNETK